MLRVFYSWVQVVKLKLFKELRGNQRSFVAVEVFRCLYLHWVVDCHILLVIRTIRATLI